MHLSRHKSGDKLATKLNYRYNAFLPNRQDTEIVGIYYDYNDACKAAWEYVKDKFGIDEDKDDEGSDSEEQFKFIDWDKERWFNQEEHDANGCDDRVHVQKHTV